MSPVRKPKPPRPPAAPRTVVRFAAADDPAWDAAIERWLLSLLDRPGNSGAR